MNKSEKKSHNCENQECSRSCDISAHLDARQVFLKVIDIIRTFVVKIVNLNKTLAKFDGILYFKKNPAILRLSNETLRRLFWNHLGVSGNKLARLINARVVLEGITVGIWEFADHGILL